MRGLCEQGGREGASQLAQRAARAEEAKQADAYAQFLSIIRACCQLVGVPQRFAF